MDNLKDKIKRIAVLAEKKRTSTNILPVDEAESLLSLQVQFLTEKAPSPATLQAKAFGLEYYGFDRWGKNGVATHVQTDDRAMLLPLKKKESVTKSPELKKKNLELLAALSGRIESEKLDPEAVALAKQYKSDDKYGFSDNISSSASSILKPHWGENNTVIYKAEKMVPLSRYDLKKMIDHSREQYAKLTDKEKHALTEYTGSSYSEMNAWARKFERVPKMKPGEVQQIRNTLNDRWEGRTIDLLGPMSSAFKKLKLDQEIIVYRGAGSGERDTLNALQPGDVINVHNWVSTSVDPATAKGFGSGTSFLIIRVPKGTNAIFAAGYSEHASESEVILDRGMKLRLLRKKTAQPSSKKWRELAIKALKSNAYYDGYVATHDESETYVPPEEHIQSYIDRNYSDIEPTTRYIFEIVGNEKTASASDLNNLSMYIDKYHPRSPAEIQAEKDAIEREKAERIALKKAEAQAAKAAAKEKAKYKKQRAGGFAASTESEYSYAKSYSLASLENISSDYKLPSENIQRHMFLRLTPKLKPLIALPRDWNSVSVENGTRNWLDYNNIPHDDENQVASEDLIKNGIMPIMHDPELGPAVDASAYQKLKKHHARIREVAKEYATMIQRPVDIYWGVHNQETVKHEIYEPPSVTMKKNVAERKFIELPVEKFDSAKIVPMADAFKNHAQHGFLLLDKDGGKPSVIQAPSKDGYSGDVIYDVRYSLDGDDKYSDGSIWKTYTKYGLIPLYYNSEHYAVIRGEGYLKNFDSETPVMKSFKKAAKEYAKFIEKPVEIWSDSYGEGRIIRVEP